MTTCTLPPSHVAAPIAMTTMPLEEVSHSTKKELLSEKLEECKMLVSYSVQLHVEAAGVTDGLSLCIASPQCGGAGVAVGAAQAGPAGCGLLQVQQKREEELMFQLENVTF